MKQCNEYENDVNHILWPMKLPYEWISFGRIVPSVPEFRESMSKGAAPSCRRSL